RYLVGPGMQDGPGILDTAYATGHAEGNVDLAGHAGHPAPVHRAAVGAGSDVVEHQFIGAGIAVADGQFHDVANHAVAAKAHALDHLAVTYVQARNDASAQHDVSFPSSVTASASARGRCPSSKARPRMTPALPVARTARTSSRFRTPPEACTRHAGNTSRRWA